jgi:hypothetical protein
MLVQEELVLLTYGASYPVKFSSSYIPPLGVIPVLRIANLAISRQIIFALHPVSKKTPAAQLRKPKI